MLRVLRSCMFSHSLGQEDQYSRLRLSGRSWFSQQTFAETGATSKVRRFRTLD